MGQISPGITRKFDRVNEVGEVMKCSRLKVLFFFNLYQADFFLNI